MQRRAFLSMGTVGVLGLLGGVASPVQADDGVAVIANAPLRGVDTDTLKRIYSGRIVELDGLPLHPVQLAGGHPLRQRFLASVLQQKDEDYVAYWTVRRYIGKGAPPRELAATADVLAFVQRTPGAIGYIEPADLKPGLVVLIRR